MQPALKARQVLLWLKFVRWVALVDLVLLIVLLSASFFHEDRLVGIFGLTHGIVFIILIAIVAMGSMQKLWSWWFFIATLVTTGPPGVLVGEIIIMRKAKATLAK